MKPGVWYTRWEKLAQAGVTREQAQVAYELFEEARAFGSMSMASAARNALLRVYEDRTP